MEKQRAKKEKVRLQGDAAAAAAPLPESARRATEESDPGPVPQEQRKTETQVNQAGAQHKGRAAPAGNQSSQFTSSSNNSSPKPCVRKSRLKVSRWSLWE